MIYVQIGSCIRVYLQNVYVHDDYMFVYMSALFVYVRSFVRVYVHNVCIHKIICTCTCTQCVHT